MARRSPSIHDRAKRSGNDRAGIVLKREDLKKISFK